MAKSFGSQIDLQSIPVLNLVVYRNGTAPTSPVEGMLWYDTSAHMLKVYTGSAFIQCDNTGVGGGTLTIQDENSTVGTAVTQLDFQGAGVTATAGSGEVVVTIPGASGSPTGAASGDLGGFYPGPTILSKDKRTSLYLTFL